MASISFKDLHLVQQTRHLQVVVPLRVAEKLADADMLYEPDA